MKLGIFSPGKNDLHLEGNSQVSWCLYINFSLKWRKCYFAYKTALAMQEVVVENEDELTNMD